MKVAFLCTALALAVAPAMGTELVAYDGNSTVHFDSAACTNTAVLSHVEASAHEQFRMALAELKGQTFRACWRVTPIGAHLVYEDGDQGLIPLAALKEPVNV